MPSQRRFETDFLPRDSLENMTPRKRLLGKKASE
jgi:hypothetical protein